MWLCLFLFALLVGAFSTAWCAMQTTQAEDELRNLLLP